MPKLPGILKPALKLIASKILLTVNCQRLTVLTIPILFSLFLFPFSFFLSAANAAEPPTPLPCQNSIRDDSILTDNWLVDENKQPPPGLNRITITVTRPAGTYDISEPVNFTVDFSQLGALFGPSNSDYLEGKFQNEEHQKVNVNSLNQQDLNSFHGPGQKAAPRVMLDQLRTKYVKYIWENEDLAESANKFADTNGQNPKTIYELVNTPGFGLPNLPIDRNSAEWQNNWGKYWEKIPTAYSEFYEGEIVFREESKGDPDLADLIRIVETGSKCPDPLPRIIKFVMPEFFRTTATSGQINQIIVPKAAQSDHSNDLIAQNNTSQAQNKNLLGKIIDACLKAVTNNPFTNALQKVIKTSQILNPIKTVFAEADPPANCIRILKEGKEGNDPYCALPAGQLNPEGVTGESCENKIDELKVDKDNPNVICHFKIMWEPEHNPMVVGPTGAGPDPDQWDECHQIEDGRWECSVQVSIWPIFRIPWTAEIWNNTIYSDTNIHEPSIGSPDFQVEGRPGVYSFFTPITIFDDEIEEALRNCDRSQDVRSAACIEVITLAAELDDPTFTACFTTPGINREAFLDCAKNILKHAEKKRPGENNSDTEGDLKRRFIGGTDCNKEFVWHNALYPRAAQGEFGITSDCPLQTANAQNPPPHLPPIGDIPTFEECESDTGIPHPDDGDNSNGFETSIEELICAIHIAADGRNELLTGLPLAGPEGIMTRVMLGESSGSQCAFAAAAEIGIFQYTAETWDSMLTLYGLDDLRSGPTAENDGDSGTVRGNPATDTCWGIPGVEPTATATPPPGSPTAFDWVAHFGVDKDASAWNPFVQIFVTAEVMVDEGGCRWSKFKEFFPGVCS